MDLETYLKTRNLTATAFAAQIKVEISTITRLLRHERRPSIDMAVKIEAETLGLVGMEDWVTIKVKAHGHRKRQRPNPGSKRS